MRNRILPTTLLAAALALVTASAGADILTLDNGKTLKGIVEEQVGDSANVTISIAGGKQKIPKQRIKSVEKEPLAKGYLHIGDDYTRLGKPAEALASYQQALHEDPQSDEAKERVQTAQKALDQIKMNSRQDDIRKIDGIKAHVRDLIRQNQFQQAEEALKSASDLMPTPAQKEQLQDAVGELYFAWAKERLDKLDKAGAEEKLNLALAAQPQNDQIIQTLLQLWEGQPEKKDQLLRIYETVLNRRPTDDALRLKVADLQFDKGTVEDAVVNYLKLYNGSDKYKGTGLEERLKQSLERMHMQYAQKKEYDQAILYFNMLLKIDPKTNPTVLQYYEYMKRAATVGDDIPARLGLAKWAEDHHLDQVALQNYRRVQTLDPENKEAKLAINRFAMGVIAQAKDALNKQDHYLAKTLASEAQTDFPESAEAKEAAAELIGRANIEIVRDQREKRQLAKDYVQRGDTCYQLALGFYRDMFNTQIKGSALVSTPKFDALRHFRCAIDAYQTAIKIDPSLSQDQTSLVAFNLDASQKYVARLTQPPPQTGFDQNLYPLR